jgi:hypothetical protein
MTRCYPNKPPDASDGEDFATLCRALWAVTTTQILTPCNDMVSQYTIGDTYEGFEFKYLKNSTNKLHIEIAERTSIIRPWVPSGIYADSASTKYMCGNDREVFLFKTDVLQRWHRDKKPTEVEYGWNPQTERSEKDNPAVATVRSFELFKSSARQICLYRWSHQDGFWWAIKALSQRKIDACMPTLLAAGGQQAMVRASSRMAALTASSSLAA